MSRSKFIKMSPVDKKIELVNRLVKERKVSPDLLEEFKKLEDEPLWHSVLILLEETDQFKNLLYSNNEKEVQILAGELIENVIKKSKKDFIVNPGKRLIAAIERKVIAEILIVGNLNAKNISWTGLSERTQKLRDKEKNRRKTNREIANKKTSRDVHQRLKKIKQDYMEAEASENSSEGKNFNQLRNRNNVKDKYVKGVPIYKQQLDEYRSTRQSRQIFNLKIWLSILIILNLLRIVVGYFQYKYADTSVRSVQEPSPILDQAISRYQGSSGSSSYWYTRVSPSSGSSRSMRSKNVNEVVVPLPFEDWILESYSSNPDILLIREWVNNPNYSNRDERINAIQSICSSPHKWIREPCDDLPELYKKYLMFMRLSSPTQ